MYVSILCVSANYTVPAVGEALMPYVGMLT